MARRMQGVERCPWLRWRCLKPSGTIHSDQAVSRLVERQLPNWELARTQRVETAAPEVQSVHDFVAISRKVAAGGATAARRSYSDSNRQAAEQRRSAVSLLWMSNLFRNHWKNRPLSCIQMGDGERRVRTLGGNLATARRTAETWARAGYGSWRRRRCFSRNFSKC